RIIMRTDTKYPMDNSPAWKALKPRPICTHKLEMTNVPATAFNKKFDTVAAVYALSLNNEKSMSAFVLRHSIRINNVAVTIVSVKSAIELVLVQPKSAPF